MNQEDFEAACVLNARYRSHDKEGVRIDLRAKRLKGLDLSQGSLAGADLSNADLRGAKLLNADFTGADLTNADLRGAKVNKATFKEACLRGAKLDDVDFSRALSLQGAIGNGREVKSFQISESYSVVYTKDFIQVGCHIKTPEEWAAMTLAEFRLMDGLKAQKFGEKYQELFVNLATIIDPAV